jgi:hypothetical protein
MGYRDAEVMTDYNGFAEEFASHEQAEQRAKEWIDGTQYRSFTIYHQSKP